MNRRNIGIVLVLVGLVALGTLVQDFRFDGWIARERAAGLAVDRELASLSLTLADLRVAQAGYVGAGQAPGSWMARATELFDKVDAAIRARRGATDDPDIQAKYDATLQSLAAVKAIDGRARAAVDQGDRLHASDVIFIDGAEPADELARGLAGVRSLEEQASAQRTGQLATFRLAMNGIAVLIISVIAVYFGRALAILGERPPSSMAQMIRDLPPPVKVHSGAHAVGAATGGANQRQALQATADLCVDLARVLDGRDVPALLERTAQVLDAKGLVLWAADTGGALLKPTVTHGYSDKVVRRLRPLQVDGDNVTALAFRTLQTQLLPGASASDSGAVAVPLITATGCVGVLAAETRQSRPSPETLPLARIVAAQFATIVAPADDAHARSAHG